MSAKIFHTYLYVYYIWGNLFMKLVTMLCLSITVCVGCFAPKMTNAPITRVPAKFDFSPPSRTESGAAKLVVALIKPQFVGDKPEYYAPPFNEMASSMANDFEELLTAKGFTIRGPFGSRDEMVYNDKLSSSLTLEVNIDLNPQYSQKTTFDPGLGVIIAPSYKTTGEVTLGGNLVITASSPQYGEKLWKKNIALKQVSFSYSGSVKWTSPPSMADELKQDNEVYNTLSRELEKYYSQALNLAWQQIEAAEMKGVADQAKKADKKG